MQVCAPGTCMALRDVTHMALLLASASDDPVALAWSLRVYKI